MQGKFHALLSSADFFNINVFKIMSIKLLIFSYPSVSTYVLGAQNNRLIERVLLSTHNIWFG